MKKYPKITKLALLISTLTLAVSCNSELDSSKEDKSAEIRATPLDLTVVKFNESRSQNHHAKMKKNLQHLTAKEIKEVEVCVRELINEALSKGTEDYESFIPEYNAEHSRREENKRLKKKVCAYYLSAMHILHSGKKLDKNHSIKLMLSLHSVYPGQLNEGEEDMKKYRGYFGAVTVALLKIARENG